ncbi:MAG: hypothetical protein P4L16_07040 [Chlamydiales bacterium]|nr:hypothetical protein [Chlamydiales bacterium]
MSSSPSSIIGSSNNPFYDAASSSSSSASTSSSDSNITSVANRALASTSTPSIQHDKLAPESSQLFTIDGLESIWEKWNQEFLTNTGKEINLFDGILQLFLKYTFECNIFITHFESLIKNINMGNEQLIKKELCDSLAAPIIFFFFFKKKPPFYANLSQQVILDEIKRALLDTYAIIMKKRNPRLNN